MSHDAAWFPEHHVLVVTSIRPAVAASGKRDDPLTPDDADHVVLEIRAQAGTEAVTHTYVLTYEQAQAAINALTTSCEYLKPFGGLT